MSSSGRLAAILPMRGQSERVPRKNVRSFNGRPLWSWILETLFKARSVDEVWVDSDSEELLEQVRQSYPVKTILRPEELRGPLVPMHSVLAHDASLIEADLFLQTHATNPLLRAESLDRAVELLAASGEHDSLFSVTPRHARFYRAEGTPVNHDPAVLERTQDLEPLLEENSCIYLFPRSVIEESGLRIGRRPLLMPLEVEESLDIDTELDFLVAEMVHRRRSEREGSS
jgi:N-acylneuraminate cytidylyltransferase